MSRILVIDDDSSSRLLYHSRLKDQGHQVVVAENGAQGLLEARREGFDLFLLSADMSTGIRAHEVCRRLKQTPQTGGVPVVLASKHNQSREEVHQGYEVGCEAYLTKSDLPALEDVVRAMLRFKSQTDDLSRQVHALEDENRRRHEERQGQDLESTLRDANERAGVLRELSAQHPDALLIVDGAGVVRFADRRARDLFGSGLERKNLGSLAPASGLEAFVRDARTETREGFRFELPSRAGVRNGRSLTASVVPIVPNPGERDPGLRVLLMLDAARRRTAAEILGLGESEVSRPELGVLREAAAATYSPARILGTSPSACQLRKVVERGCDTTQPVLLHGEAGAGKTFVARALHYGMGSAGPFVSVDCTSLSVEELELELFGQARSAARADSVERPGLVQRARHGTVLLAGLDETPPELQERVLNGVLAGEVRRVGSERPERVDVRWMVELRSSPERAVAEGRLLADLAERLDWLRLEVQPLRARPDDVRVLAQHFLERFGGTRDELAFDEEALRVIDQYGWPENVRELQSCVERACAHAEGNEIQVDSLPQALRDFAREMPADAVLTPARRPPVRWAATHHPDDHGYVLPAAASSAPQQPDTSTLKLEYYEKRCLLDTLDHTNGDKLKAAKILGIGKSTLYRKLKKYDIH